MLNRRALAGLRLGAGLLVLTAIGWQFRIHVQLQYSVLNFFSYFTNLANLLAALVFIRTASKQLTGAPVTTLDDALRFMAAINMVIVGIVFAILLRNVDLGSLRPWINILLHYVMPVLVFVDWLIDPPRNKINLGLLLRVLLFPIAYLAYTLIRGNQLNWYPYPFLNPVTVGGYGNVAMYAAGITIVFVMTGLALMKTANRE